MNVREPSAAEALYRCNPFRMVIGVGLLGVSLTAFAACLAPSQPPHNPAEGANRSTQQTEQVVRRFNQAFQDHDPTAFPDLVARDCVMETIQPAPDGQRVVGYEANVAFWQALAADRSTRFDTEDITVISDRAMIRWRIHFGEGQSMRGVTLLRVRDGRIAEALAYSKVPGEPAPLPAQP
jgi:ketosteroid isomerase-like protein